MSFWDRFKPPKGVRRRLSSISVGNLIEGLLGLKPKDYLFRLVSWLLGRLYGWLWQRVMLYVTEAELLTNKDGDPERGIVKFGYVYERIKQDVAKKLKVNIETRQLKFLIEAAVTFYKEGELPEFMELIDN